MSMKVNIAHIHININIHAIILLYSCVKVVSFTYFGWILVRT